MILLLACPKDIQAGEFSYEDFVRLYNHAAELKVAQNYEQALLLIDSACVAATEMNGEYHADVAMTWALKAMICYENQDYEEAAKCYERESNIRLKIDGEKSETFRQAQINLSNILTYIYNHFAEEGDLVGEQMTLDRIYRIQRTFLPKNDPQLAITLNNLSILCNRLGRYEQEIQYLHEAVQILESTKGTDSWEYAAAQVNMATVLTERGHYTKAAACYKEALPILRNTEDKHEIYATTLNNLATLYHNLGQSDNEEQCLEEALALLRKQGQTTSHTYALMLANQGVLLVRLGNPQKAEQCFLQAAELQHTKNGFAIEYATTLYNLGELYVSQNRVSEALEILQNAHDIVKSMKGEVTREYASILSQLARVYHLKGDATMQKDCLNKALRIQKAILGENHPEYANTLYQLSLLEHEHGHEQEQIEMLRRTLALRKQLLGEHHPDYIATLTSIGTMYANQNQYKKAEQYMLKSSELNREYFLSSTTYLSERQRNQYWSMLKFPFEQVYPVFAHRYYEQQPQVAGFMYDNVLFIKGLLLSASNEIQQSILASGDTALIRMWNEVSNLRQSIVSKQQQNPEDSIIANMEQQAERIEKEMLRRSAVFQDNKKRWSINWKDVQSKLRDGDVAVEFQRIPITVDSIYYGALVLRDTDTYPHLEILCSEKKLLSQLSGHKSSAAYEYYQQGQAIANLIWKRLKPYMNNKGKVYFSPDGILYQLAIEYLPYNETQTWQDVYPIVRLSSTRELCMERRASTISDAAVLYGGLIYERAQSTSNENIKVEDNQSDDMLLALLNNTDTTTRGGISYLVGTLQEVKAIQAIRNNPQDVVLTGELGNEESFKALSGVAPRLLHIGTHGFYLPHQRVEVYQRSPQMGDIADIDYSMSCTGLLLAGAATVWNGEKLTDGSEDGVLTAKEIASLDLKNVEMTVLSACETGSGDITGDGVAGLQRGFKQAGVQTLLMSLWPVSDQATQLLMTEFYRLLQNGETIHHALKVAQHKVREKYEEAEYWAAFILLDAI